MNLSQLLQAFAGEIEALAPELQLCVQRLRAPADEEAFLGSVQDYASLMQRWAEAAQTADFDGLNLACMAVMESAMLLAISPVDARSAGIDFLADWPTYLLPCLRHPAEADPAAALVQYLSRAPQGLDAQQAWRLADWLPARLTALSFAVVGSFEEAIDSWRSYAQRFPDDNDGVVLAATSGALNVRLGGETLKAAFSPNSSQGFQTSVPEADTTKVPESTPGREPELGHLRSVVGLVWRSVVVWMLLLALLTLARLLG